MSVTRSRLLPFRVLLLMTCRLSPRLLLRPRLFALCGKCTLRPLLLSRPLVGRFARANPTPLGTRLLQVLSPVLRRTLLTCVWFSVVATEASLEPSALDESRRSKWCSTLPHMHLLPVSWQRRCGITQSTVTQAVWGMARILATGLRIPCVLSEPLFGLAFGRRNEGLPLSAWSLHQALILPALFLTKPFALLDASFLLLECVSWHVSYCCVTPLSCTRSCISLGLNAFCRISRALPLPFGVALMTLPALARNGAMTFVKPGVCFVGVRSLATVLTSQGSRLALSAMPPFACYVSSCANLMLSKVPLTPTRPSSPLEDPRAKLGVLRRLLSGGLQTRDRDPRRRNHGRTRCACGRDYETVVHLSLDCSLYDEARADLGILRGRLPQPEPPCFTYATLVPVGWHVPSCLVAAMQRRLVCVWQTYIGRWHESAALTRYRLTFKQPPPAWYRAPLRQMNCNGHVLRACPRSQGVFCVKCGRTQKQWKQRWKITRLPCRLRHTPESQWLSEPTFHHNANRVRQNAAAVAALIHGEHVLLWNGRLGKCLKRFGEPTEGLLYCTACCKTWRWAERHKNFANTTCSGTPDAFRKDADHTARAVATWCAAHPDSHNLVYSRTYSRWQCARCGIGSARRWDRKAEVLLKTACKRAIPAPASLCFHKVLTGLGSSVSLKRINFHDMTIGFLLCGSSGHLNFRGGADPGLPCRCGVTSGIPLAPRPMAIAAHAPWLRPWRWCHRLLAMRNGRGGSPCNCMYKLCCGMCRSLDASSRIGSVHTRPSCQVTCYMMCFAMRLVLLPLKDQGCIASEGQDCCTTSACSPSTNQKPVKPEVINVEDGSWKQVLNKKARKE